MRNKFKNNPKNAIKSVTLPQKGWGYYSYIDLQGQDKSLIIKKNPFNTYSVLVNGSVMKITNLEDYINSLNIAVLTGFKELGEMSNKTVALTGNMIDALDERHLNDIMQSNADKRKIEGLNAQQEANAKAIEKLQAQNNDHRDRLVELQTEKHSRKKYFDKYLKNVATMDYKKDGWDVKYTPANHLQASIGVTTGYHREHYSSNSQLDVDMSGFLSYLKSSLPEDVAPQIDPLIADYKELDSKIEDMDFYNTDDSFAKASFSFKGFADNFVSSMIQLKQMYPDKSIDYYSSYSGYDRSDEPYDETYEVKDMLTSGLKTAEKIVTDFYGKEKAEAMFAGLTEENQMKR